MTDEEPCEGKLSRTVLKTSRRGDSTAEFNPAKQIQRIAGPEGGAIIGAEIEVDG